MEKSQHYMWVSASPGDACCVVLRIHSMCVRVLVHIFALTVLHAPSAEPRPVNSGGWPDVVSMTLSW